MAGLTRYTVAAKSPLTEATGSRTPEVIGGPELKFSGYDAIVITGKSEKPSVSLDS